MIPFSFTKLRPYLVGSAAAIAGMALFSLIGKTCRQDPAPGQAITTQQLDSIARLARIYENANGQLVAENKTIKEQSAQALQQLSGQIFNLEKDQERLVKKVTALYQVNQVATVGGITAPFVPDTHAAGSPVARVDSIAVPQRFELVDTAAGDTTLRIAGIVTAAGVQLDSPAGLQIPNTLYLRPVELRAGFLGLGREWKVQGINTSPYFRNTGIAEIRLQAKPSAWNAWIKPLLAAVLAAAGTVYIAK